MLRRRRTLVVALAFVLCIVYRFLTSNGLQYSERRPRGSSRSAAVRDDRLKGPLSSLDILSASTSEADGPRLNYTRTLVVANKRGNSVRWIDDELGDLLQPRGTLEKAVYVAGDDRAPLHPPANKGNEVNSYLTYLIDHYDELPDIVIFTHADRFSWHNNELMDMDLAGMIRYLIPEKVLQEGYVNLRCHWDPGCPDHIHPRIDARFNPDKTEEQAISQRWGELFPSDDMPRVLSQPCCSQFAVSRERILQIPKQRYLSLRSWILETTVSNYNAGRIFEYLWQYIWVGKAVVCPAMHMCYCELYGICFGGSRKFDKWFELRYQKTELESRIRRGRGIDTEDTSSVRHELPADLGGLTSVKDMEVAVARLSTRMSKMRDDAFLRGGLIQARVQEATFE